MTASNGFPSLTTAGQGLFNGASSNGMIVGQADPDPSTRNALRSGIVSGSETVPMWGGMGVYADIASTQSAQVLGAVLGRAATVAAITGFSVFDQGYNAVSDPMNTVPNVGSGQSLNWYALGSRARIAVAAAASLVALRGEALNTPVSWDPIAQELVPYAPVYLAGNITGATWASNSGGEIVFTVSEDLTADLNAGDLIETAGVVSTGGAGYNGQFAVLSVTSTQVTVSQSVNGGTYVSGGTIAAGGGQLAVTVLDIQPAGNMVPQNLAGGITYNYNGAAAKIQLTGGTVA